LASKYSLAEQVLLKIKSGFPDIASGVKIFDLMAAVGQKANQALKYQYVTETLASGERIPNNTILATYQNLPITSYGLLKSKFTLPIAPISLPRNMGLFAVSIYEDFRDEAIPIQSGQAYLMKSMDLLNDLLGLTYSLNGMEVVFEKNVILYGFTVAYVKEYVMSMENYGDKDVLPIPAELEGLIVDEVFKVFAGLPETLRVSDTFQPQQKV
jgi:hypothetical protein